MKKALSFRAVELTPQGQCERDGEVVRLASQERVHATANSPSSPVRSSERFGEQDEIVEMAKFSGRNQILQCTGDQILTGFAEDRVQQLWVEQCLVPQMMEQL